jgi:TonB family protein
MSLTSTRRFVTVAVAAVAASYLSGGTSRARAAQEQSGKTQNRQTCSPKPFRVGSPDSRPRLYVGPSTISNPTRIVYVKPEYSESARTAKAQGIVVLEAQIELDGRVCNPRVLRSIPLLDQSAIDAVLQWRFTPAKRNGVAVPVITTITVNFTLQ